MLQQQRGRYPSGGRTGTGLQDTMTEKEKRADSATQRKPGEGKEAEKPDWAEGLKKFYDSVVDEPLPDELSKLLAQFEDGDDA